MDNSKTNIEPTLYSLTDGEIASFLKSIITARENSDALLISTVSRLFVAKAPNEINELCIKFFSQQENGLGYLLKFLNHKEGAVDKEILKKVFTACLDKDANETIDAFQQDISPEIQKLLLPQLVDRQVNMITASQYLLNIEMLPPDVKRSYLNCFSKRLKEEQSLISNPPSDIPF